MINQSIFFLLLTKNKKIKKTFTDTQINFFMSVCIAQKEVELKKRVMHVCLWRVGAVKEYN